MFKVDFGKTANDYKHRAGFPQRLFERLAQLDIGMRGQRILDLGSGTGALGREFAKRGAEVVGVEPSAVLISEAKRLDVEADVRVDYVAATAERTMLDENSFDVVCAGQAWHWFDRAKAVRELKRVVRPDGRVVIAHFDWLPLPGNPVASTEELIDKYNPEWKLGGSTGLHPAAVTDMRVAGFEQIETFSFDVLVSYSHAAWCGSVRASAGVQASLSADEVARFDQRLHRLLRERHSDEPMDIPHCVWALTCRAPG